MAGGDLNVILQFNGVAFDGRQFSALEFSRIGRCSYRRGWSCERGVCEERHEHKGETSEFHTFEILGILR